MSPRHPLDHEVLPANVTRAVVTGQKEPVVIVPGAEHGIPPTGPEPGVVPGAFGPDAGPGKVLGIAELEEQAGVRHTRQGSPDHQLRVNPALIPA